MNLSFLYAFISVLFINPIYANNENIQYIKNELALLRGNPDLQADASLIKNKHFACRTYDTGDSSEDITVLNFDIEEVFHKVSHCTKWKTKRKEVYWVFGQKVKLITQKCLESEIKNEFLGFFFLENNSIHLTSNYSVLLSGTAKELFRGYNWDDWTITPIVRRYTQGATSIMVAKKTEAQKIQLFGEQSVYALKPFKTPLNYHPDAYHEFSGLPQHPQTSVFDQNKYAVSYIRCIEE